MDEDEERLLKSQDALDQLFCDAGCRSVDLRIGFDIALPSIGAFSVAYLLDNGERKTVEHCSKAAARQMALDILTEFFERRLRP
jgi:hypothetical protein